MERVITSALVGRDQAYQHKPWVEARTIEVNSRAAGFTNFSLTYKQIRQLHDDGYTAAVRFLAEWDWAAYLRRFRRHPTEVSSAETPGH